MTDWAVRVERLADEITASGKLRSPAWRTAVCTVPRHELVPGYYEQDSATGRWHRVDPDEPKARARWLDAVYSDTTLITAVVEYEDGARTRQMPVSSATKPGLVVRMLEQLDIRDGNRVLEIGTGSGYTAALLCARLGSGNVHSVDLRSSTPPGNGSRGSVVTPPWPPSTAQTGCLSPRPMTASSRPAPRQPCPGLGSSRRAPVACCW